MNVDKIKKALDNSHESEYQISVLDILNRGNDEDMISKLIRYVFVEHPQILSYFLEIIFHNSVSSIHIEDSDNELSIDNGQRIDIFMKGKCNDNEDFLVVIENKVWSSEHSHQCEHYYRFIRKEYENVEQQYFIYLKPRENQSTPNSDHFVIATYDELYQALNAYDGDDYIVNDFKNAIMNNLMEKSMNELEKTVLVDYRKINNSLKNARKKLESYFTTVLESFDIDNEFKLEIEGYSLRLYRNNWWSTYQSGQENLQFYFYIEICWIDFDVSKIVVQQTAKIYRKDGMSVVDDFKEYKTKEKSIHRNNKFDWWVLRGNGDYFRSDHEFFSTQWKEDFEGWVVPRLKEYATKQTELFGDFEEYLKMNNIVINRN